ncbi:MAG: hypothetical protein ACLQNE_01150 [Thermoguttaceae bacterium]
MPAELVASSVVVVARQFNPSVFSNLWLVRNGIAGESEFLPGCMYSDQVAKMETVRFGLLVIPPQLQLQPRVGRNEEGELVATTVGRIVKLLPHIPYVATGLNFVWHVWPDDGDISRFSKSLFMRRHGPFQAVFGNAPDALFGGYFSMDVLDCRLRLDVKPVDLPSETGSIRRLLFGFNYQADVPTEGDIHAIERHLGNWELLKAESDRIVGQIEAYTKEVI